MRSCPVCRKPIEECREADKQLITPYDPRNKRIFNIIMERYTKATKYVLGCYNPDDNLFYEYGKHITIRHIIDARGSLPLCVYEGDNYMYKTTKCMIVQDNIYQLPLSKKYHNLLKGLIVDDLYDNLPDLP